MEERLSTFSSDPASFFEDQHEEVAGSFIEQQKSLSALLRITQVASSTLSMEEVLYTISQEIINATGAWGCNSFLFPERSPLGYYYVIEPKPPLDYRVPDPPDAFTLEALKTAKPVFAEDVMTDPRTDKRTMRYFGIKSALAFPLVFQGKSVAAGFSCYDTYHRYTEKEIEIVMAIAGAGAMAVANARLHNTTVQLAIAQERNRIAKEMHDSVLQSLATIKLNLNILGCSEELSKPVAEKIEEIKSLVDESYIDLRDTVFSFRASGATTENFVSQFKDYAKSYQNRFGIHVCYDIHEEHVTLLSHAVLMQTGRILSEALINIRKHAQASSLRVWSSSDERNVIICVEDDGIGMQQNLAEENNEGHFGLRIMKERAADAGALLTIESAYPQGTRVTVGIPYR